MNRTLLIVVVVVLIVLVAGAAFVAGQMLLAPDGAGSHDEGESGRVMVLSMDDGSGPVTFRIRIEPNPALPDRPPEAAGVFVSQEDNSIFVGTGSIELDVEVDGNTGERTINLSHSGPEIEVVVTHDTILYREETEFPSPKPGKDKSRDITIVQAIEPVDSLDEVGENTELQVWGTKRGDRIVAEVLVYRIVDGF